MNTESLQFAWRDPGPVLTAPVARINFHYSNRSSTVTVAGLAIVRAKVTKNIATVIVTLPVVAIAIQQVAAVNDKGSYPKP